ncbi:hypothetical protein [Lentzea sp. NPDC003310]|uniref:hypothetical protein n=1 Tax=Lentzea sp. NPDC003310 TaxID=3154447 RepID=UPI0033ADD91E
MFTGGKNADPVAAELARMMVECRFAEVVERTEDLGAEPDLPADRAQWRLALYIRSVAFVNLLRYDEAEAACQAVLRSADADGDHVARVRVLGYGIAAAFLQGRVDEALGRLDEVLAAAEAMEPGPEQTFALVAAATTTGIIGLSELSDRLISQVVDQVTRAGAPEVIHPGVMGMLHALMVVRRCQLAIALESRDPGRAAELYRSVLRLAAREGCDASAGGRPAALFRAHHAFARIAVADECADLVIPESSGPDPDPLDMTTEIMWGLCRLRLFLRDEQSRPAELRAALDLGRGLTELASRLPTLVLRAECFRMYLAVAERGGDALLTAMVEERHEAAVHELEWSDRLEWASFSGFRSTTMRNIQAG